MTHKEIATHLYDNLDLPGWWCQMVTVGYERIRGLREKHQTATGYSVSASRVIPVPLKVLFNAVSNEKTRSQWLTEKNILIRKATPQRSVRIRWVDGESLVAVYFYSKDKSKSQISIDHTKLPNAVSAKRMKTFWKKQLDKLSAVVTDH